MGYITRVTACAVMTAPAHMHECARVLAKGVPATTGVRSFMHAMLLYATADGDLQIAACAHDDMAGLPA